MAMLSEEGLYLLWSSPCRKPKAPFPYRAILTMILTTLQAEGPFPYALVARAEAQCYFELPDEVGHVT